MKKQFMGILLTLCMVLTLLPTTAFAADASSQNLYQVGSNPVYRLSPNGEIIGEFPSGTIVEVIEIKGDWARVRYEGQEYYMWAPRLTKVGAGTTSSNLAEKPFAPPDGWYTIETPNPNGKSTSGHIIIGNGGAVVDLASAGFEYYWQRYIYVDNIGNDQVTLKTLDGKYLGISDPIKDGTRVRAVDSPYVWNAYTTTKLESAQANPSSAFISFRPPQNTNMIVNVSGWKLNEEGAHIILWSSKLGTVDGNAKLSWGEVEDPAKTLTMRDLVEILNTHVMERLYGDFSLSPSQGIFPPASDTPYKNYYWDGSGPDPYEGLKDAAGNLNYDYADVPNWVGRLRMWGVLPGGDYNGTTEITYGQFTGYLKKLMAYGRQNAINWGKVEKFYNPRETFTDDIIKKFGFGDSRAESKITFLQAMLICDATVQWWYASAEVDGNDAYVPYKKGDLPFPYKYASIVNQSSQAATPAPAPTPTNTVTATPTNTKFMLNGAEVALPAYSIGGNNYVKLRDVGALLKTRFDVRFEDGKAKLYNHAAYTKTSGELAAIGKDSKNATLSTTAFVWGDTGAAVTGLTAYTIGGNNYIKLRDIAKLFDFDVDWRDGKAWIEPDVSPYTED
jgi:uncharacterized protein YgiM (DUF1202 family)